MKRELPKMITPDLTAQEVFDYVSHFLFQQGEPSIRPSLGGDMCAYRGANAANDRVLMCAVGCILPDEIYRRSMEGNGICEIRTRDPEHKPYWDLIKRHEGLFCSLQAVHDDLYDYKDKSKARIRVVLLRSLQIVAQQLDLEFDEKDFVFDPKD